MNAGHAETPLEAPRQNEANRPPVGRRPPPRRATHPQSHPAGPVHLTPRDKTNPVARPTRRDKTKPITAARGP